MTTMEAAETAEWGERDWFWRTVVISLHKVRRPKKGAARYQALKRYDVFGPSNDDLRTLLDGYGQNIDHDLDALENTEVRLARELVKLRPGDNHMIDFHPDHAVVEFATCRIILRGCAQLWPEWTPAGAKADAIVYMRYDAGCVLQAAAARNPEFRIKA